MGLPFWLSSQTLTTYLFPAMIELLNNSKVISTTFFFVLRPRAFFSFLCYEKAFLESSTPAHCKMLSMTVKWNFVRFFGQDKAGFHKQVFSLHTPVRSIGEAESSAKRGSLSLGPWQTRSHCCRQKCFLVCGHKCFLVADTNFVSGTQKMFPILFRNILCPQQMFPSLRSPRNIMGNNVSSFARAFTFGAICARFCKLEGYKYEFVILTPVKYQVSFHEKTLSSHVKRSPSLWLHNKLRLFQWCLYNKQNITRPLVDMNFIFSCSTRT